MFHNDIQVRFQILIIYIHADDLVNLPRSTSTNQVHLLTSTVLQVCEDTLLIVGRSS